MRLSQASLIGVGIATGCIVTGVVAKQPLLEKAGELAAIAVLYREVSRRLERSTLDRQQQIDRLMKENTSLRGEIDRLHIRMDKSEKKIAQHHTSHRLSFGKINKLAHEQKVTIASISKMQERLPTLPKVAPVSETSKHDRLPLPAALRPFQPITHVYIDGNNLNFVNDSLLVNIDYKALYIELSKSAKVTTFKYYIGVPPSITKSQRQFISYLQTVGFEVVPLPVVYHANTHSAKTVGDDVKLVVDMLREVRGDDRVILVSGDGDFVPAIKEIQQRGARVTVVGKQGMLSQHLAEVADDLVFFDNLQDRIAKHTKLNIA
jgi:uncharacterized LabA/DUF88 family protein